MFTHRTQSVERGGVLVTVASGWAHLSSLAVAMEVMEVMVMEGTGMSLKMGRSEERRVGKECSLLRLVNAE